MRTTPETPPLTLTPDACADTLQSLLPRPIVPHGINLLDRELPIFIGISAEDRGRLLAHQVLSCFNVRYMFLAYSFELLLVNPQSVHHQDFGKLVLSVLGAGSCSGGKGSGNRGVQEY